MPNLEEHCRHSLKSYGVEGRDIHSWLDDPSREYAGSHRQFRHDTETVRLVGEIFGKTYGKNLAENIALDHIMVDHEEEIKKRNTTIIINLPEQKEIPSIPCNYCDTLLKPSDQICPKCGASRTKIIDAIDRNIEMEKLKLQQKKKEIREELKLELQYRGYSPLGRLYWLRFYQKLNSRRGQKLGEKNMNVLERLVTEDLQNDPSLDQKFNSMTKEQKRDILRSSN